MGVRLEKAGGLLYNVFMAKNANTKQIIITVIACVVFIAMLSWYAIVCIIQVNYHYAIDYRQSEGVKYVAHRGLSGEYFQNTYEAFRAADNSAFFGGIECDIRMTKDGVWVCSHDDTPFKDKKIKVSQSYFDEIKNLPLDTTDRGENVGITEEIFITAYEQFLNIMRFSRKRGFVEIKGSYDDETLGKLVDFTKTKAGLTKIVFIGFDKKVIESIASYNISAKVMLLTNKVVDSYFYVNMGYNVGLNKNILDKRPDRVKTLHKNNSFAYVYTINSKAEAEKYEKMGVDYIVTDYDFSKA